MSNRIFLFDTTLRDGEQSLQASLSVKEKLEIALALENLGVDIMELGFPISSNGDFTSVQTIARQIKNSRVCALSRALKKDIDVAYEALKVSKQFRIHTFLATSTIHVESKLRKTFDDVVNMTRDAVKYARNYTDDVEFSCEDAGRTPIDHLCKIVETAINAGATTVNIPDTVGYTLPIEFGGIIKTLFEKVPNIDKAIISVHCHNDLGMATANSITAIQNGARQIECAMNGLGERAGNCSLEEVALIIKTRGNILNMHTNIDATSIAKTSQLVSKLSNVPVPINKAIVGANAFSHSSGIHQDGVLKNKNTYEIITPESVGFSCNNLNMTARSGRHVIKHHLETMGYKEDQYNLDEIYSKFLELADKKGQIFDYDLEALLFFSNIHKNPEYYKLESVNVLSGNTVIATACVKLSTQDGETLIDSATGNGPIDAIFKCIGRLTKHEIKVTSFNIKSKGEGMDALGQVDIIISHKGRNYHGMGLATDIIEAGARSLIHALNSVYYSDLIQKEKQNK